MLLSLSKLTWLFKKIFPHYIWDIPNNENKVFITFDDGPTIDITEWTLEQLEKYNAKATFFCIGKNILKYSETYEKVLEAGHYIGNHTSQHLNGWDNDTKYYLGDIGSCRIQMSEERILRNPSGKSTTSKRQPPTRYLFRPPYGKMTLSQSKLIRDTGYKIVMWDVISFDYDENLSPEKCLKHVLKNIKSGSIIVFHDSKKAFKNLEYVLPRTLDYLQKNGFVCAAIDEEAIASLEKSKNN